MSSRLNSESEEWLYLEHLNMEENNSRRGFWYYCSCEKIFTYFKDKVRPHLTWKFLGILLWGQFLSLVLCATGVAGQKLVIACGVKIPAFQAFCSYVLLSMVFTTQIFYNWEVGKKIFIERWWKYIVIAVIDAYANFLVYTAYQYTSLTSVQLLDCLSIPAVVLLSIVVLKAKYGIVHFVGVFVCLAGIGLLVYADFISRGEGPKPGDRHSELLGDFLVIAGACCYAASNIAEEFVVKTSTITEFLGMLSFFASFISGANVMIFEWDNPSNAEWNKETIFYLALSAFAMFAFYILMPVLIRYTSATLVNLILLTADLYSLFAGLYLFGYTFSYLYIVSFVTIVSGVVIFKIFPTPSRVDPTNGEEESNVVGGNLYGSVDEEQERNILAGQQ